MTLNITYNLLPKDKRRKEKFIPEGDLPFGLERTDHMFLMDYDGSEWGNPRIVPYGPLDILLPGAIGKQYAQEIFEGAKAFKHEDEEIYTFRIDKNAKRMNSSADIMCMPHIPEETFIDAINALIDVDRLWFPEQEGASLYIRPSMYGTQDSVKVKSSGSYTFEIFLSPSGPYYSKGFTEPIKLLITEKFHRAVPGGSGAAKTSANYGPTLRHCEFAKKFGAEQVLYLDSTNTFIEEACSMNHFHVTKDQEIVIPEFTDTILRSITSESVLELDKILSASVRQEMIELDDFISQVKDRTIVEAGGLGTAAAVTSVGAYVFEGGRELQVGEGDIGEITKVIFETITGIQNGKLEDPNSWMRIVDHRY